MFLLYLIAQVRAIAIFVNLLFTIDSFCLTRSCSAALRLGFDSASAKLRDSFGTASTGLRLGFGIASAHSRTVAEAEQENSRRSLLAKSKPERRDPEALPAVYRPIIAIPISFYNYSPSNCLPFQAYFLIVFGRSPLPLTNSIFHILSCLFAK